MAIETGGRLVGEIQTYVPPDRALSSGVYELGISLYDAADRGKGLGTETVRLFVGWLFERGAERVQGATAPTNAPMRRVFQKLGFGELAALQVEGAPEILYGISRSDWDRAAASTP